MIAVLSGEMSIFTLMKKGQFLPRVKRICKCGNSFEVRQARLDDGRGEYCSKACMYKYRTRPSGLVYVITKENPTSFKPGLTPWNKGIKTGIIPANFKGENVGYDALHDWVRRHRGKATVCEYCSSTKSVQWANKSHSYKRDLTDWLSLCRKCHIKYDRENNAWGVASKKFKLTKWQKRKRQSASGLGDS